MSVDKGIVTYFDGEYGEIVHDDDKYIFLKQDIINELTQGELVCYKGEEVQGIKRAYFVNPLYQTNLQDSSQNKQKELIYGEDL